MKDIEASALMSWITHSGGSQHHILRVLEQSGEFLMARNFGHLPTASTNLPPTEGLILKVDPPVLIDILTANL